MSDYKDLSGVISLLALCFGVFFLHVLCREKTLAFSALTACLLEVPILVLNFYCFCLFFKENQLLASLFVTDAFSIFSIQKSCLTLLSVQSNAALGNCAPKEITGNSTFLVLYSAFGLQLPLKKSRHRQMKKFCSRPSARPMIEHQQYQKSFLST